VTVEPESTKRERDFRTLGNAVPGPALRLAAADFAAEDVNGAWSHFTGLSRAASLGTGWIAAVHPDDLTRLVHAHAADDLDDAGHPARLRSHDGAFHEFTLHVAAFTDAAGATTGRLAFAARVDAEQRAYALADAVPAIVWVSGREGGVVWFNREWYAYTGLDERRSLGDAWMHAVHPDDLAVASSPDDATNDGEQRLRIRGYDGVYRWFATRITRERDAHGNLVRRFGSAANIDTELRAGEQLAFFAQLAEELAAADDLPTTLAAATRVTVPRFGDWAFVARADASGALRVAAVHHRDPAKAAILASLVGRRYATGKDPAHHAILAARRPLVLDADRAALAAPLVEAWADAVFREMGFAAAVVVPLARAEAPAAVLYVVSEEPPTLAPADIGLLAEVGRRVGPAIVRAEAYERERRIATTFQQAALPPRLPMAAGVDFAALYQPGSSDVQVGGDFYDAFVLPDGRVVLAIGDVSGSGLGAAVTMSEVRQSIRGAAAVSPDPAVLLDAADRAVRGPDHGRFVTAWVAVLDPVEFTLSHASAGHQPPLVGAPDGAVSELAAGGLPLGLRGLGRLDNITRIMPLASGTMLLLYTDGLTESTHDLAGGERRLRAAFASALLDPSPPQAERPEWLVETGRGKPWRLALAMRDAMLDGGHATDDVAILVVEFVGSLENTSVAQVRRFPASDGAAAAEARTAIVALLEAYGTSARGREATELAFAELVGNVARHAGGEAEVVLDMSSEQPVLHVMDRGPGFAYAPKFAVDAWSTDGRGLMIVNRLAADFSVTMRYGGGSHARFVVPERTHGAFRRSDDAAPSLTP
jgi:PAS domain-containing protein/anti-sigma regulatory factor (Ser/Thr protein kinase)